MRQIENVIISDEVWQSKFSCDLVKCLGKCCQYGDLGAPISEEEAITIEENLNNVSKYLSHANIKFLRAGVSETYQGSLHIREIAENTPCPLAYIDSEKKVLCSLHSFALENNLPLLKVKPLWCTLFPLILKKSGDCWMINCHIPPFCKSIDNSEPLLFAFADILQVYFGKEWIEAVRNEYKKSTQAEVKIK